MILQFELNLLKYALLKGPNPFVQKFQHRSLKFGSHTYHRVYAKSEKGFGVGVDRDLDRAQVIALSECLERDCFFGRIGRGTTNGLAAHFKKSRARTNALIELVERDQALLSVFYSKKLRELESQIPDVRYFYMTHDLPIHVVLAEISIDSNRKCYGWGSGFDLLKAKEKAFKESLLLYDSRDQAATIPDTDSGNLWHILPFLKPDAVRSEIHRRFSLDRYQVDPVSDESIPQLSERDLHQALQALGVKVQFESYSQKLVFPFSLKIERAFSDSLQDLFFSKTVPDLNLKRLSRLGYAKAPIHDVIHPIS